MFPKGHWQCLAVQEAIAKNPVIPPFLSIFTGRKFHCFPKYRVLDLIYQEMAEGIKISTAAIFLKKNFFT